MAEVDASAVALLREIRDQQRRQIDMQEEALAMQREMRQLSKENFERAERLQHRVENTQKKAGKVLGIVFVIAIPAIILLLVLALWPTLARMFG